MVGPTHIFSNQLGFMLLSFSLLLSFPNSRQELSLLLLLHHLLLLPSSPLIKAPSHGRMLPWTTHHCQHSFYLFFFCFKIPHTQAIPIEEKTRVRKGNEFKAAAAAQWDFSIFCEESCDCEIDKEKAITSLFCQGQNCAFKKNLRVN